MLLPEEVSKENKVLLSPVDVIVTIIKNQKGCINILPNLFCISAQSMFKYKKK